MHVHWTRWTTNLDHSTIRPNPINQWPRISNLILGHVCRCSSGYCITGDRNWIRSFRYTVRPRCNISFKKCILGSGSPHGSASWNWMFSDCTHRSMNHDINAIVGAAWECNWSLMNHCRWRFSSEKIDIFMWSSVCEKIKLVKEQHWLCSRSQMLTGNYQNAKKWSILWVSVSTTHFAVLMLIFLMSLPALVECDLPNE